MFKKFIIIGAGPAGISAGYELSKAGFEVKIFEKSSSVGGLAKTMKYDDCLYDIGPHRFFTLNKEIENFYLEILNHDAIEVKRFTRILYNNKLFLYPLSPFSTILKIGFIGSVKITIDYIISLFRKIILKKNPKNFEDWIILNFGKELYQKFFKSYTEKVWGVDCKNISKDWAAQRIKNLSFINAILSPIFKIFKRKKIKTLVDQFWYPKFGAGQFYEKIKKKIENKNVNFFFEHDLDIINHDNYKVTSLTLKKKDDLTKINSDFYFLSCPFTEIVFKLQPQAPKRILDCCNKLKYRHHIGVKLEIHGSLFKDNWIYIHDPKVKMARVSNYLNFSKSMSPNSNINPITVEYFCYENDALWNLNDSDLILLAEKELRLCELLNKKNFIKRGFVVRSLKAYPVIEMGYEKLVEEIKNYLSKFTNLVVIGRSGMFKYNNQDHAIATGLYAARNVIAGKNLIDIWKINSEGIYQEGQVSDN